MAALGNNLSRRAPNATSISTASIPTASISTDTGHAELSHYRATVTRSAPRTRRRGAVANIVLMTLAGGLVATMGIPAYAFAPTDEESRVSTAWTQSGAQSVEVAAAADTVGVARDGFTATTPEELAAVAAAAAAAAAAASAAAASAAEAVAAEGRRQEAAAAMTSYAASYSGPSSSDYLAAPAYSSVDLGSVFGVASGYQGVPYVYGGATPAGFDCSGFIMYVYAQFGISLPHSSVGQGAAGVRIPVSEAQPGDLVIMDGHDGFYAGNGNILHAPYEGASVRVQPIWTSSYYIVRIGL